MIYPEFAYSTAMQIILFFVSCSTTFLFFWFTMNLVLSVFGERVSVRRRVVFTLLVGIVLNQFWIYGIFALGGFISFSPDIYSLVTMPNPFFAMLYYYIAVKVLGLPSYRSIRLMRHYFAYCILTKVLNQIIGKVFFAQGPEPYNYLLDAMSLCVDSAINLFIYYLISLWLRRSGFLIRLTDSTHTGSKPYELTVSFLQACAIYAFVVGTPKVFGSGVLSYTYIGVALFIFLVVCILLDHARASSIEMENKDAYIHTLISSIDSFDGIRHDFSNILQTYGGFISIGNLEGLREYHERMTNTTLMAAEDLDLNRRMHQNPALISLLIRKLEYAKSCDVVLRLTILCSLEKMNVQDMDLCRVVGNLLDNAVEAACTSTAKRVSISIEQKRDGSKLIVISNSTMEYVNINTMTQPRVTTKESHLGLGLTEARRVLGSYPQCSLQFSYYDMEFSAYIEILPS